MNGLSWRKALREKGIRGKGVREEGGFSVHSRYAFFGSAFDFTVEFIIPFPE
jgi:hypothetical protein